MSAPQGAPRRRRARTPLPVVNDPQWEQQAACRDPFVDPRIFHPDNVENSTYHAYDEARKVCGRCPVRDDCLADALLRDEEFGMRGGLTPNQRLPLRGRAPRGSRQVTT